MDTVGMHARAVSATILSPPLNGQATLPRSILRFLPFLRSCPPFSSRQIVILAAAASALVYGIYLLYSKRVAVTNVYPLDRQKCQEHFTQAKEALLNCPFNNYPNQANRLEEVIKAAEALLMCLEDSGDMSNLSRDISAYHSMVTNLRDLSYVGDPYRMVINEHVWTYGQCLTLLDRIPLLPSVD